MNDREFIELLNLYVDHEISPEDALRLEAEVMERPERRAVYNQYCRIQKACSMLSEELLESAASETAPNLVAFPQPRRWSLVPPALGLAAAAAIAIAVVALRDRGNPTVAHSPSVPAGAASGRLVEETLNLEAAQESMKPVFFMRLPSDQAIRGEQRALFDAPSQMPQLDWIGDIHMPPVFAASNNDLFLSPKTNLKAAALSKPQGGRDEQEPAEMTAFRFQR